MYITCKDKGWLWCLNAKIQGLLHIFSLKMKDTEKWTESYPFSLTQWMINQAKTYGILCYISPFVFASINVQRYFLFHIPNTRRLLGYCCTHISSTSTNLTCIATVVSLNQRKMTTVKIHQMGGLIQHKTQGTKEYFLRLQNEKRRYFLLKVGQITQRKQKKCNYKKWMKLFPYMKPDKKPGLMWTQTNMWMLPKLFMDITLIFLKTRFWLQPTQFQKKRLIC